MHEVSRLEIQLLDANGEHVTAEWRFESKPGAAVRVGRAHDNDVVITDRYVSRYHAEICYAGGAWHVLSLGRHGMFHGGAPIDNSHRLRTGLQELQLGGTGMTLRLHVDPPEPSEGESATQGELTTMLFGERQFVFQIAIDEDDKSRTVDEIASGDFFQALQIARQRLADDKDVRA